MNLGTGSTSLELIFGAIVLLTVLHFLCRTIPIPKGLRLPPGPRGKPLIGNVSDLPSHHEWETYTQWGKEYGDLVHIKVLRQSMIFVNSASVARDLFDTRSSIYSDRPRFPMLSDLMGFDWASSVVPYGQRWRQHRRVFHRHFHPKAATDFYDIQITYTQDLLRKINETPADFVNHLRHLAGATILKVVYGFEVLHTGDPYVEAAEKSIEAFSAAGNPGTFLVDIIPILKHVPEWIPGAGFRRKARIWREMIRNSALLPFQDVKKALRAGTAQDSVVTSLLTNLVDHKDSAPYTQDDIRDAAGTAYLAGYDTTVSMLSTFILAMVLYPQVQRKAQAELDSFIGMGRLPTFEDRDSLPYVNAICKEIYRWRPVLPLAIAHRVTQDDAYGDYFIPEGSLIIGNTWAIFRDESMYGPETNEFRPERFLVPGVKDPVAVFGFGRRMCPGRYMADNSIFIAVASILKVFDISHARDEHGKQIPVEPAHTSGLLSYPEPFQCTIKPRSASSAALI